MLPNQSGEEDEVEKNRKEKLTKLLEDSILENFKVSRSQSKVAMRPIPPSVYSMIAFNKLYNGKLNLLQ
jgi:hypothetical protein